jgi:hypothetical protein
VTVLQPFTGGLMVSRSDLSFVAHAVDGRSQLDSFSGLVESGREWFVRLHFIGKATMRADAIRNGARIHRRECLTR